MERLNRRRGEDSGGTVAAAIDAQLLGDVLSCLPPYCDVAKAQLADVIAQTEEAAIALMEHMDGVDTLSGTMADDVHELSGTVATAQSKLAGMSDSNIQVVRMVHQLIRFFVHRDGQLRNLVAQVDGLSSHVAAIETVTRATKILALNAKIEAVRAGTAGAGFAVVADEVRKLSDSSDSAAKDIGGSIVKLTAELRAVLDDDSAFTDDAGAGDVVDDQLTVSDGEQTVIARRLLDVSNAQRGLAQMAGEILQETIRAAAQVEQASAALSERTTGAVGEVQFQDIGRQMIEQVAGLVDEIRQQVVRATGYTRGEVAAAEVRETILTVDDLNSRYVMDRQRHSHAEATGGTRSTADLPAIELF